MGLNRIRVLSPEVASKIACGEVVESPASVVKELIENALDASAKKVFVEIEGGGISKIRVVDDGCGIPKEDLMLAIGRYSTSKVEKEEDLYAVKTFGFRGEALWAIREVSRLTIKSKAEGEDEAWMLLSDGEKLEVMPTSHSKGTTVEVCDLFYNVPARLKFQKGKQSLKNAIEQVIERYALAFFDVHFLFSSEGRKHLDLPPCKTLEQRVLQLFNEKVFPFRFVSGRITVTGVLGDPKDAKSDPSRVLILVNKRPVVDASLRRAVLEAFSPLVEKGYFPRAIVSVELPSEDVDVNVHPRKIEVRFKDQREVSSSVFRAVYEVVAKAPWTGFVSSVPVKQAWSGSRVEHYEAVRSIGEQSLMFVCDAPSLARHARFLGQAFNLVLIFEENENILFIDQHAAHERILFNELMEMLEKGEVMREALLFPEEVLCDPESVPFELLGKAGIECEAFSEKSVIVRSVPLVLKNRSVQKIVLEAQDVHRSGSSDSLRKIIATIACHSAIRAGDAISENEAWAIFDGMKKTELSTYCPHGRQVVVVFPKKEVLGWFGR
jgi:DNA mismatch repair protein MutL